MGADLGRIRQLLIFLYGAEQAEATLARVAEILGAYRSRLDPPRLHGPWTAADVFLITYPDQIRQPGSPPLATLLDFCRRHLDGSITGVHLLPFYPSSSDEGFSVIDYRAVDPEFGTWDQVQELGSTFRLMVDLVLNHASARSAWFEGFLQGREPFRRYFVTPDPAADWSGVLRPRTSPLVTTFPAADGPRQVWTTFSADQVDLDYRRPEVLLEMIDILLGYVEMGAQMVRLDAVTYVWKEAGTSCAHRPQGHALVRLLRAVLDQAAPWVRLITETNVPHLDNIAYFGDGDEADLVYQFALPPLVLHTLASGSAEKLGAWAESLSTPPGEATYFNFLASHDGIGITPAHGILTDHEFDRLLEIARERGAVSLRSAPDGATQPYELNLNLLDGLSRAETPELDVPRLLAAHAVLLAMPGVPAVYIHSLLGSRGDLAGMRETGQPRRVNRRRFELAGLQTELESMGSERQRTFDGITTLIRKRAELPAFHPRSGHRALDLHPGVFAVERRPMEGAPLLCLQEISGATCTVGIPAEFRHGSDRIAGWTAGSDDLTLEPYQSAWIEARR